MSARNPRPFQPLRRASGGRGLRLYRGGKPFGFWEAEAQALQAGDTVVEVIRCEGCEAD